VDLVSVRLECLKLAVGKVVGREPSEIVTLAKHFENYIIESTACSASNEVKDSGTSEQRPNDSVKAHNKHSKK